MHLNLCTGIIDSSHDILCVCVCTCYRSEAETRMKELELSEAIEEEIKKKMQQIKIVIVHDTKLHSFMEKKFQEIIPLKEDEDSKKRSIICHRDLV